MTAIAPHVTTFLRERLPPQRGASPNTCDNYAYALKLFFEYASQRVGVRPSALTLEQLDAPLILMQSIFGPAARRTMRARKKNLASATVG